MSLSPVPLQDENNVTSSRNARICYEQVLTTASGNEALLTQNTFDRVTIGSTPQTLTLSMTSTEIDYIAIAGHSLGAIGATVEIQWELSSGGANTVLAVDPTDDRPILVTFDEVTADEVHIVVTGGTNAEIAHVRAGKALVMQQPLYGGHSPRS